MTLVPWFFFRMAPIRGDQDALTCLYDNFAKVILIAFHLQNMMYMLPQLPPTVHRPSLHANSSTRYANETINCHPNLPQTDAHSIMPEGESSILPQFPNAMANLSTSSIFFSSVSPIAIHACANASHSTGGETKRSPKVLAATNDLRF